MTQVDDSEAKKSILDKLDTYLQSSYQILSAVLETKVNSIKLVQFILNYIESLSSLFVIENYLTMKNL